MKSFLEFFLKPQKDREVGSEPEQTLKEAKGTILVSHRDVHSVSFLIPIVGHALAVRISPTCVKSLELGMSPGSMPFPAEKAFGTIRSRVRRWPA